MSSDWATTRGSVQCDEKSASVPRHLGGTWGVGRLCSIICVPRGSLELIISFTEDVKSSEMLEGGRDSKDVFSVSELYLLPTSVSLSSGSFND